MIRHYHHIDRNRNNNEIWNLVSLSYNDHIIEIHNKNNQLVKDMIYDFTHNNTNFFTLNNQVMLLLL